MTGQPAATTSIFDNCPRVTLAKGRKYGRFSGGLSVDNPYYQHRHRNDPHSRAVGSEEYDSDDSWVAAEVAVAEGHATPEQERRVREDAQRRAAEARRRAWELHEHRRAQETGAPPFRLTPPA